MGATRGPHFSLGGHSRRTAPAVICMLDNLLVVKCWLSVCLLVYRCHLSPQKTKINYSMIFFTASLKLCQLFCNALFALVSCSLV